MPKKDFTSFDIAAVVQELQAEIPDARVNNIYQQDAKTLVFKLHKPDKPPLRLVVEAGKRLHLTQYALDNPHSPPAFCMALRKYLRNAWLLGVEQYEFERIVALTFKTYEGNMKLVAELFGEGNLILVNPQNIILQALAYKRMRDRNILRNEAFQLPPASGKNPFKLTQQDVTEIIAAAGDTEVVRALARSLGVGGAYAEELLLRANVDKTQPCSALSEPEISTLFAALQTLLAPIQTSKLEPCIYLGESGEYVDVAPFQLKRHQSEPTQTYPTFNVALDEFYSKIVTAEKAKEEVQTEDLKREVEKLQRVVDEQQRLVSEAEEKAEAEKHLGDTIYAHLTDVQQLLDLFERAKNEGKPFTAVAAALASAKNSGKAPFLYYSSFDQHNLALNVQMDDIKISLNLRKNLYENAAEYYDRGKRIKQKSVGAAAALEQSQKQLAKVQAELKEAEQLKSTKPAEALEELVKRKVQAKEWFEKFRYFTSSEGFLVVAGKDQVSNEVLIKKHTETDDVVFHAEITGSPFVVIKAQHKEPGEATLKEAGEFAASYCRAWREGLGSADVYWVKPEQLAKSGPSGEFVPHGAFFVSGKRNWMRNTPLQVAVGATLDGEVGFVGGPVDAVAASAKVYVVLKPGDLSGKEVLKQILRTLSLKLPKEQRAEVARASVEKIREFVPYTKGRIIASPT